MARAKLVDKDLGWKAFKTTLEAMERLQPELRVGVLASAGTHKGGGASVAQIAAAHEFGLGVPERSFLRSTFDANREDYEAYLTNGLRREVIATARTGQPLRRGNDSKTLRRLGLKVVGDVQQRIADGIDPPLAQSTIDRKGSSTPLIDTGQMRASITFVIGTPVPGEGRDPNAPDAPFTKQRRDPRNVKDVLKAGKRGLKSAKRELRAGVHEAKRGYRAAKRGVKAEVRGLKWGVKFAQRTHKRAVKNAAKALRRSFRRRRRS